ncbi:threonine aldolase family protein [Gordonia soli]|uniref:L-threonine aldolase n=1 Tax=Gordonia soli NBRC 108243 TaxID=1223545 RepID=M0QNT0_9ACTN|nr:beta-eliminating lyase-related protein [Gordonia soli]GAC70233.1 putative L-threonine aldolase [Gordonia soli NBRC 108243]
MSFKSPNAADRSPDLVFASDNSAGAAPEIIEALARASAGSVSAYGADPISRSATGRVREVFDHDADLHCVSTGSAANAVALAALADPWGSILCHRTAHIQVDECGAPEFFTGGAKLTLLDGDNGKIDPAELSRAVRHRVGDVHSVQPQVLSLTQATEWGTAYSVDEVRALSGIARDAGLRVHLDGARIANALAAADCSPAEMTWRAGVDILSLGITKNGGLTTDAIVSFDPDLRRRLGYRVKRAGQLTSKMRFSSAQVDAYLTDDLWLRNAAHANAMAQRLADGLRSAHVEIVAPVDTNMIFCRLEAATVAKLRNSGFVFHYGIPEPGVARLVTSFATSTESVDALTAAVADSSGHG